ncbi:probable pathogenesis-related protein ARB_02861 isoform X2 [Triticum dicoccoides]|nr:probable pathogenesis-related protein ARB_02861 isoform X2 [Triticum dicoccoides]
MDCNGCVHKIRKTLSGIDGVGEVHVDQANHKITVVGIADPARIVKAIRKANRVPTICSHTDPAAAPAPPAEGGEAPPADPPPPPPAEGEAPPPAPADPPPAEEAPAEPPAAENKEAPPAETPATTMIYVVRDYPYSYHAYRGHWANHPSNIHGVRYDAAAPYYAAHSRRLVATVLTYQSTDMRALQPKKEDATTIQRLLREEEMEARSLRCSARRIPTHAA